MLKGIPEGSRAVLIVVGKDQINIEYSGPFDATMDSMAVIELGRMVAADRFAKLLYRGASPRLVSVPNPVPGETI
jgi:hypothetical protein